MIKVTFLLFVSIILGFAERGFAQDHVGSGVGNGGDPLRGLFSDARNYAGQKAQKIKTCSLNLSVPRNIGDWIIAHRPDYMSDILRSQQVWITDQQPTCAWTHDGDASDITLSFEACRPLIKTVPDAAHILFHESVHHFGITDENFAEAVANAMDSASGDITCPEDPQDPFNPDACSGSPISPKEFLNFFQPGGKPVQVGQKAAVSYRHRHCLGKTEDLCTEWSYDQATVPVDYGCWHLAQFQLGARFSLDNNAMNVRLEGNGEGCAQRQLVIQNVGKSEISADDLSFPSPRWEGATEVFNGKGRMTKDCIVLKAQRDMENEAAVLVHLK